MDEPSSQTPSPGQKPPGVKPKPQLTKAQRRETQERQKAEKAAKLAAAGGNPSPSSSKPPSSSPISERPRKSFEGNKPLARAKAAAATSARDTASVVSIETENTLKDLRIFSHFASSRKATASGKIEIHPAIQRLALQFSDFRIVGGNARCIATVAALKEVIRDYSTPEHSSFSRQIMTHISPHINHLVLARPLSMSMSNLIRHLKLLVTKMSEEGDIPERDAKHALYRDLDTYIHERIYQADGSIVTYAIEKITKDKDSVIMTYGRSSVVEQILLTAHDIGRTFSVVIVDSGPLFEGKRLLHSLSSKGIRCSYALVPALSAVLHNVNLVLLGAHSLYANGSLYSRAGTALVAMMASHRSIPVLACCETYKFSNGVPFDGFAKNELASHLLTDLQPNLQALNPLYDLTPATSVSAVITEYGLIPPSSVPTVLWRLGIQE